MSDKKMTLEQVRDWHRQQAAIAEQDKYPRRKQRHNAMAYAIDAEIKARGEAVAFRYLMPIGNAFTWTRWLEIGDIHLHSTDGRKIEYAYTAPPAPKINVTPDFVHSVLEHYPLDESGHFRTLSPVLLAAALEAALKVTP